MSKEKVGAICKYASIVFVILALLMHYSGWLTIADKDTRKDLKQEIKSYTKEFKYDKKEIKELQEELDEWGIDLNVKKTLKQCNKIFGTLKDVKLSNKEISTLGSQTLKLANSLKDDSGIGYLLGSGLTDELEELENAKGVLIVHNIFFYITILIGLLTAVLHALNKKFPGISLAVLNLLWWIVMGISVSGLNKWAEDELYFDDKLFALTAAPFWAFAFALCAVFIWMFKDKIADKYGTNAVAKIAVPSNNETPSANVCPSCGTQLNSGAVFCPNCGNKVETIAPVQDTPSAEEQLPETFCGQCGNKIPAGVEFCSNCGAKRV